MNKDNLQLLRERKKDGFLQQVVDKATPIKHTATEPPTDYEELVSSILDE